MEVTSGKAPRGRAEFFPLVPSSHLDQAMTLRIENGRLLGPWKLLEVTFQPWTAFLWTSFL